MSLALKETLHNASRALAELAQATAGAPGPAKEGVSEEERCLWANLPGQRCRLAAGDHKHTFRNPDDGHNYYGLAPRELDEATFRMAAAREQDAREAAQLAIVQLLMVAIEQEDLLGKVTKELSPRHLGKLATFFDTLAHGNRTLFDYLRTP